MDSQIAFGVATIVGSGAVFSTGIFGVRTGRHLSIWTIVLAIGGAGLAGGALLVQNDPSLVSWLIALPVCAVLGAANVRALFGPGGQLRD